MRPGIQARLPLPALALLSALTLLPLLGGCRDQIAAPTMGFLDVATGDVTQVDVWVDDRPAGQAPGRIGPLEAGTHRVRVAKLHYDVAPGEVVADVRPAETTEVSFALVLVVSGSLQVDAADELDGGAVGGAAIWLDTGAGLQDTGRSTPAVLEGIPPGPAAVVLRKPGFEDSVPFLTNVGQFDTTVVALELGPLHGVLAEMTTFVTCPNCPASVDTLDALGADHPEDLYVVEWHTVEPLPLSDPVWVSRKVDYYGIGSLGDPTLIVQGDTSNVINALIGGSRSDYRPAVENALDACSSACPVILRTEGTVGAGSADVTARIKWRGSAIPGNLVLRIVLEEDEVEAPGNDSPYSDVPRILHEEPVSLVARQVLTRSVSFPLDPAWAVPNLHWTAFIQSDDTLEVLAVHGGP